LKEESNSSRIIEFGQELKKLQQLQDKASTAKFRKILHQLFEQQQHKQ
jgi:hypothetical protein